MAMKLFEFARKAGKKEGFHRSQLDLLLYFIDEVDALGTDRGFRVHFDTENVHVLHLRDQLVSLNVKGRNHIVWMKDRESPLVPFCKKANDDGLLGLGPWTDERFNWFINVENFFEELAEKIENLPVSRVELPDPERSRAIPIETRRHADAEFIASGGECPGYGRAAHDPGDTMRHYDHITPFSRGGSHDVNNVRILCAECNLAKSANPE